MNNKQIITRTSIIFVGMTIAGICIAIAGKFVPDAFTQMIMIAIGSSIFSAALAYFLIRIDTLYTK